MQVSHFKRQVSHFKRQLSHRNAMHTFISIAEVKKIQNNKTPKKKSPQIVHLEINQFHWAIHIRPSSAFCLCICIRLRLSVLTNFLKFPLIKIQLPTSWFSHYAHRRVDVSNQHCLRMQSKQLVKEIVLHVNGDPMTSQKIEKRALIWLKNLKYLFFDLVCINLPTGTGRCQMLMLGNSIFSVAKPKQTV